MTLVAFIAVNGADALLTALSIVAFGADELNPFLAAIAWNDGVQQMILIKILLSVAIGGRALAASGLPYAMGAELGICRGRDVQRHPDNPRADVADVEGYRRSVSTS
jgi:hypothetical protein